MHTIDELKNLHTEFLLPNDVAHILGCNPHSIRVQARSRPEMLGFPVVVIGNQTRIPRRPFIQFMERL